MAVKLLSNSIAFKQTDNNNDYSGKPITEIIANGFFTVDRKWTVQYWNKAGEKLLGVSANDIVGRNLWEKFAGVLPLDFYFVYHKAFLEDIPVHFEEYWGEMGPFKSNFK
jgi:PAS domain S-box-containing protein